MSKKQSNFPMTTSCPGLDHLSDVELLRQHDPVTRLECELYARLSSCLTERDALHVALAEMPESTNTVLDGVSTRLADSVKLNSSLCVALEQLKTAARTVIAHWEQGNLARAVNDLRHAVDDL